MKVKRTIFYSNGSQNVTPKAVALASPSVLLEMHIVGPYLRCTESETLGQGMGPAIHSFASVPDDSDLC